MPTKTELTEQLTTVSSLLYEAIAILRQEVSKDEDELDQYTLEFLQRCQMKGFA